jgi:hypothetical protein
MAEATSEFAGAGFESRLISCGEDDVRPRGPQTASDFGAAASTNEARRQWSSNPASTVTSTRPHG